MSIRGGFDSVYQHQERKTFRYWVISFLKLLLVIFIVYQIFTSFFLNQYTVGSISMQPVLEPGDVIITSPIAAGPVIPVAGYKMKGLFSPKRGDLVAVRPANTEALPWYYDVPDRILRFFTFNRWNVQKIRLSGLENDLVVKRVIGLPGDELFLKGHVVFVKPYGTKDFIREDLLVKSYSPVFTNVPTQWDLSLPMDGDMLAFTLKDDEYFILGDNRAQSADSRQYGPVSAANITGYVLLRLWPMSRFGYVR